METAFRNCAIALLYSCICISTANAQQYSAIDLYKLQGTSNFPGAGGYSIESASSGQVAGSEVVIGPVFVNAVLWSGPNGAVTLLSPTSSLEFSSVYATNGVRQVGDAYGPQGDDSHAVMWSGTADSVVDLHPTKLPGVMTSIALGMGGGQQVGFASTWYTAELGHAVLWQGTADSAIDLHPTNLSGFSESFAYGTDGARQVGMAGGDESFYGVSNTHAILWSGTADSALDLHPTKLSGFDTSKAVAISGMQQVGSGSGSSTGGKEHALLWFGSAASAGDLNPTLLTYIDSSTARGTNGTLQVGSGHNTVNDSTTALLWSGTPDSAIDLGALLPANFTYSDAYSIDPDGTVWGIAIDADQSIHAVEWTLVPEPAMMGLAMMCALCWLTHSIPSKHTFTLGRLLRVFVFSIGALAATVVRAAPYTGVNLYTLSAPSGFNSISTSAGLFHPPVGALGAVPPNGAIASNGQAVGQGVTAGGERHALVWTSPTGSAIDLHPVGFPISEAIATNGSQQVGYGEHSSIDGGDHALLWNGSAASAVDLNPPGFGYTYAFATDGTHQVGEGRSGGTEDALLWTGTATSVVDLKPVGAFNSAAFGTRDSYQVGTASTPLQPSHATLWKGSAASAVDLNPIVTNATGTLLYPASYALSVSGLQQVGFAYLANSDFFHAMRWNGTAASAVDLNPSLLGENSRSVAFDTNGTTQVGFGVGSATGLAYHAMAWSGTADSAIDLNDLLPFGAFLSTAMTIDAQGNIFGTATDLSGNTHAVEWMPLPEPSSGPMLLVCGIFAVILATIRTIQHS